MPLPLVWWPSADVADTDGRARLTITAPARTDMFHDPAGSVRTLNAPRGLAVPPAGDFQLSARVSVDFGETYDAGALLVWVSDTHWAKLCFERSPQGETMAVSVITRGLSDDANGLVAPPGEPLWLRISRVGRAWAFHAHPDGQAWSFVRHFSLDETHEDGATIGFEAQSPMGEGCTVTFDEITFVGETLADLRSGV